MRYSEQEEKQLIIKLIVKALHEQPTGMMWGQMKRLANQGYTNYRVRIGLEMMIAHDDLNKRSGLKWIPRYIEEAERLEAQPVQEKVYLTDKKIIKVPVKVDFNYKKKKLKEIN